MSESASSRRSEVSSCCSSDSSCKNNRSSARTYCRNSDGRHRRSGRCDGERVLAYACRMMAYACRMMYCATGLCRKLRACTILDQKCTYLAVVGLFWLSRRTL